MARSVQLSRKILSVVFPITVLILTSVWPLAGVAQGQQGESLSEMSPHEAGEYVGLTKCAACHFDQYKDWRGSEHNRAFEILPLKYRTDASCLECHTTAIATDIPSHPFGVSCESCHGPGGEHAKYALQFVNEIITEEALTSLRSKIRRLDMLQCVKCHVSKAHKKHPPYDRDEVLPAPSQAERASTSFFDRIHASKLASESEPVGQQDDRASQLTSETSSSGGVPDAGTRIVRENR